MSDEERTPDNWDPDPAQRTWLRNVVSGQLGWIVRRDGKDCVRLDRPQQEIVLPLVIDEWNQEFDHRPFAHAHLVQIAFEADRALLRLLGDHLRAKETWNTLSDKARAAWLEKGPLNPPARRILYRTIVDKLSEILK